MAGKKQAPDQAKGELARLQARVAELEADLANARRPGDAAVAPLDRLRQLLDSADDAVWCTDAEGRFTYVSRAVRSSLGYEPDALIGKKFEVVLTEAAGAEARAYLNAYLRGELGTPRPRLELVHRRRDGRVFYGELFVHPILDDQGRLLEIQGITRDVTDRKRAEDALRESEQRYRRITEELTDYLYTVRVEQGRAVETTHGPACEVVTGYKADEFTSDPNLWMRMVVEDDRDRVANCVKQILAGEPIPPIEHRIVRKDGRIRWVSDTPILRFDIEGKLISYEGVIKDITERKRAESALRESEERFRLTFDEAPIGAAIVALDHRFMRVNEAFCRLMGYSAEELTSLTFKDITFPDDLAADIEQVRRLMAGEIGEYTREKRYVRKDGRIIWGQLSVRLIADAAGTPLYFLPLVEDVTARKRAEEALQASLAEKEILLREVHHRVKNNLAAIVALLDLQRQAIGDAAVSDALTDLAGRIKSMALVHERLYRSPDLAHIDFEDYVRALISHLRTSLGTRSTIRCVVSAAGVEMGLDMAVPCGMVINELVTNAIKHAFPEGREPRVDASHCELAVSMEWDGGTYTLVVADNGIGLPANLDWTTTKSLGLRLVRMIGQHQLGALITVDGTNGTRVELKFGLRN